MPAVIDPVTGLELYELSHRWGMYTPIFPGYEEIKLERITHHAKQGVMTHKITTIFHTSTHLNAPIHLVPGAPAVGDLALERFFGTGVVVALPKKKWGLIEPSDLERAKPQIKAGIATIENVGGDLDALSSKRCTFQGFPWKWHEGDACVIRLVAMLDPKGTCRLERGAGRKTSTAKAAAAKASPAIKKSARGTDGLQFFHLSHPWGHGMPQWPSRA